MGRWAYRGRIAGEVSNSKEVVGWWKKKKKTKKEDDTTREGEGKGGGTGV